MEKISRAKEIIKTRKAFRTKLKKIDPNFKEDEHNFYINYFDEKNRIILKKSELNKSFK